MSKEDKQAIHAGASRLARLTQLSEELGLYDIPYEEYAFERTPMPTEDKKHFPREARNWQELRERYRPHGWYPVVTNDHGEPFAPHHLTDLLERECPELLSR